MAIVGGISFGIINTGLVEIDQLLWGIRRFLRKKIPRQLGLVGWVAAMAKPNRIRS